MKPEREYRIFVRDLVIPCSIGAYPQERLKPQRVRFNVALQALWPEDGIGDDLERVLNYKHITDGIRALVSGGHVNLVETLAERIADMCLDDARIVAARVSVEKLDVEPSANGIGVEIERRRAARAARSRSRKRRASDRSPRRR